MQLPAARILLEKVGYGYPVGPLRWLKTKASFYVKLAGCEALSRPPAGFPIHFLLHQLDQIHQPLCE